MEKKQITHTFQQVLSVLPQSLRKQAMELSEGERNTVEEFRMRAGRPMAGVWDGRERELGGPAIGQMELQQLLELASHASLHMVLPQLRQGYLTIAGGHRLGLCGRAVMREGEMVNLRPLSSASLRVARQITGAAGPVLEHICPNGKLTGTLILAPPGLGKTTLLRDIVRSVSNGEGCMAMRVSLADERGEVAAMWEGVPQLQVGRQTDVMEGCPKGEALMLLLRAMNPQVLAVDEITAQEDVAALELAAGCGAVLLATAHGESREDLKRRSLYRPLLEEGLLQKLVCISRRGAERIYTVEELE